MTDFQVGDKVIAENPLQFTESLHGTVKSLTPRLRIIEIVICPKRHPQFPKVSSIFVAEDRVKEDKNA